MKRYREPVEIVAASSHGPATGSSPVASVRPPVAFVWRGSTYRILSVLGHWREDAGYWAGGGMEILQRDLWRVEARNGTPASGIYELVCEQDAWRLDRVWD